MVMSCRKVLKRIYEMPLKLYCRFVNELRKEKKKKVSPWGVVDLEDTTTLVSNCTQKPVSVVLLSFRLSFPFNFSSFLDN